MKKPRIVLAVLATLAIASSAAAQDRVRRQGPPPKPFSSAEMSAPAVEVPMLAGEGIVVEVRVNGKGPYKFALDTGAAGGGRISPKIVEALGLPAVGEVLGGDPSGQNSRSMKVVEAASLAVGGATFHRVQLVVREFPKRRSPTAAGYEGILGIGLFQDLLLTLDYPARRVRIGAQVVERPRTDFVEIFPHANIGHAFLSRFAVTLDQKNGRIRFKV